LNLVLEIDEIEEDEIVGLD